MAKINNKKKKRNKSKLSQLVQNEKIKNENFSNKEDKFIEKKEENNSSNEIKNDVENNNNSTDISSDLLSANVKRHREKLKKLGFKQVSVYLAPDIYKKLKFLKIHRNKSYANLISDLIAKEYESFKKRRDIPLVDIDEFNWLIYLYIFLISCAAKLGLIVNLCGKLTWRFRSAHSSLTAMSSGQLTL